MFCPGSRNSHLSTNSSSCNTGETGLCKERWCDDGFRRSCDELEENGVPMCFRLSCEVSAMSVVTALNCLETVMSRERCGSVYYFVSVKSRGWVSAMRDGAIMNCDEALVWMLMRWWSALFLTHLARISPIETSLVDGLNEAVMICVEAVMYYVDAAMYFVVINSSLCSLLYGFRCAAEVAFIT